MDKLLFKKVFFTKMAKPVTNGKKMAKERTAVLPFAISVSIIKIITE